MNIKTRISKIEANIKKSNKGSGVGIIQMDTNKETGSVEIKDRDKLVFSGSAKAAENFLAGLRAKYEVLIIDDIPRWQE